MTAIDGYRPAEGLSLLQPFTDIRIEAEFRHRQTQCEDAARAAEAAMEPPWSREDAEQHRRDAQWAREDWLVGRKERTVELARIMWNSATT